jgi:hypothetical protein
VVVGGNAFQPEPAGEIKANTSAYSKRWWGRAETGLELAEANE